MASVKKLINFLKKTQFDPFSSQHRATNDMAKLGVVVDLLLVTIFIPLSETTTIGRYPDVFNQDPVLVCGYSGNPDDLVYG